MQDFDVPTYLKSKGLAAIKKYTRGDIIYAQGELTEAILFVQAGTVKLSVVSPAGREAILATFHAGDFFGESALSGKSIRVGTARADSDCTILSVERDALLSLLHDRQDFSDRFINYMVSRNARIEADLLDQLLNTSERRLARALLLLAQNGDGPAETKSVKVSQETLAKTIGSTRTRVNYFMNKFRKAGYIDYSSDGLKVHHTLVNVLLHD